MQRKTLTATLSWVYLGVVALIVVGLNVLFFHVNCRADLTKDERFTLSLGSKRLVSEGLTEQMKVDLWVTRGTADLNTYVDSVTNLLTEYEKASKPRDCDQVSACGLPCDQPCFTFRVLEAKTKDDRKTIGDEQCGQPPSPCLNAFPLKPKELTSQEALEGDYMGMIFRYGAAKDAISQLCGPRPDGGINCNDQGLEFWITNKVREVRDNADAIKQRIGVITGKDEIKLTDPNLVANDQGQYTMKTIIERAFPFYEIVDVDLQGGEAEIDPDLRGVIVTQPGKDYDEKELRRIDQFLMRGDKSLVVFAGAVNMKASDATMKATLSTHGLEKLLDGYGVEMKKEAVIDWGRPVQVVFRMGARGAVVPLVGIALAQHRDGAKDDEQGLDNSFIGFFRMESIGLPFPSTLVPHPEAQPEAKFTVVARTSKKATVDDSENIEFDLASTIRGKGVRPKGDEGQRAVIVAAEGTFKSAFKPDDKIKAANPSATARLLVVASGQFLANPLARAGNPPPMPPQMQMMGPMGGDKQLQQLSMPYAQDMLTTTILAFKNIIDWMSGDQDLVAVSAKLIGSNPLTYGDLEKPANDPDETDEQAQKKQEEYTTAQQALQTQVIVAVIVVPPLLFALIGLLRLWLRRSRRKEAVVF